MCNYSPTFANHIVSSKNKNKVPILFDINCWTKNVLYYISCIKSERPWATNKPGYNGQTGKSVCDRSCEHKHSVNIKASMYKGWQTFL